MPHPSSCTEEDASRPALAVADIVRTHGPDFRKSQALTPDQARALRAIAACRTPALGGHLDVCPACGYSRPAYNSCRNRHCPTCQGTAAAAWIEARKKSILPSSYFHMVFTLPEQLRPLVHRNRRLLFKLLFDAATQTLLTLAADSDRLGALIGITAVLHTWTRDLSFHPHLHCVVTGGGLARSGEAWIESARSRFLFPVAVMSALFRGKFMAALVRLYRRGALDLGGSLVPLADPEVFQILADTLYRKRWVVYAKKPFGGPQQVFAYLGLYTHRVAISNGRLVAIDQHGVRFTTKDHKIATLTHHEFLRRFLLHVLPKGFVKIRHYGLLASRHAHAKLDKVRTILAPGAATADPPSGVSILALDHTPQPDAAKTREAARCPLCAQALLLRLPLPVQRPPPARTPS